MSDNKSVVSGKVTVDKKGPVKKMLKKTASIFFADSAENMKDRLIYDIAIPYVKKTIMEGVAMLLGVSVPFNQPKGSVITRISQTNYNGMYNGPKPQSSSRIPSGRKTRDYDNLIFEDFNDAVMVLKHLQALLEEYKVVSVLDLYNKAGIEGDPTADMFGWTKLDNIVPLKVDGGYSLNLPNAMPIDR